jgi:FkbM family methyltransferase
MNSRLSRVITRVRVHMFPTEHDKEFQRWKTDHGDEEVRYKHDLDAESLAMDVGGYKGQWASDIYARYNCRVLVFEPVKSFAQAIKERFKKNPRIEVFCLALGASRKRETISLSADGSSVYGEGPEKETIEYEDVARFFQEHDIKNVDILKINAEGGEYELLPRLVDARLINRIKRIQIQFHKVLPDAESRMVEIWRQLEKTHRVTYRYKFVWENWVRLDL